MTKYSRNFVPHFSQTMSPLFTFSISKMTNNVVIVVRLLFCLNCVVLGERGMVYPHGATTKKAGTKLNSREGKNISNVHDLSCRMCDFFFYCAVVVPLNSLLICVSPLICLIE